MFATIAIYVPNRPVAEIRYEMTGHHLYVPVFLDGRGPFHFIFDTGASATIIDTERAKESGLKSSGSVSAGGGGATQRTASVLPGVRMTVGATPPATLTLYGIPLNMIARSSGRVVDGILGYDFFSRYVVEVDYAASTLRLYAPEAYRYTGNGETLPFRLVTNHVRVQASLRQPNREWTIGAFTVDTGAADTITLTRPFVEKHDLLTPAQKRLPRVLIGEGVGGMISGVTSRVQEFRLGSIVMKRPVTSFTTDKGGYYAGADLAGTLGYGILHRFKVIFNYPRKEITFEHSPAFSEPDEEGHSGLVLEGAPPTFHPIRVRVVVSGSVAEHAGICVGDVLLRVNGRSADTTSLEALHHLLQHAGERVSFVLQRGTTTVNAKFVVAAIV